MSHLTLFPCMLLLPTMWSWGLTPLEFCTLHFVQNLGPFRRNVASPSIEVGYVDILAISASTLGVRTLKVLSFRKKYFIIESLCVLI